MLDSIERAESYGVHKPSAERTRPAEALGAQQLGIGTECSWRVLLLRGEAQSQGREGEKDIPKRHDDAILRL